ncbi:pyridoxamine 5'-phosphate oxidase family protein [Methanococcus voltae]|uniref:Flavin-nucleotide-binding protein-like protein n=1 Tax=Methanococcus voltae (strain ATCC BAA-1334 / A3) TaxID=456320 RepID=D7DSZ8_METV3|nr:pyridoxamine 5'-phosphate oxidase family protein [Methanococcus voltae]MCS3901966.1 nitroimidazol reductase NimA-like FMN-containing flavoprotein (pyridoxamine 5'-phosphate oxidase superfamily) [Methanococcus voltae]
MVFKIPSMNKKEYDDLLRENYVSRIAFGGSKHPYIAPFLYVFDGEFIYFLSTKYGRKIELLKDNPQVSVEIDKFAKDMSCFKFMTLQGTIIHEEEPAKKDAVKQMFVDMIVSKNLSKIVLEALGQSSSDSVDSIIESDNTYVWKLVDVEDIIALKNKNNTNNTNNTNNKN